MIPDEPDIALHMPLLEEYASQSRFIVELGCGDGNGSLRALARGFRRSPRATCYVSVDLRDDRPKYDRPIEPWWHLLHGDSSAAVTVLAAFAVCPLVIPVDLVFIDTAHTYEQMSLELENWGYITTKETIWLFHDTWMGAQYNHMTDAIKEFAERKGLVYDDVSRECNGLGRMTKP